MNGNTEKPSGQDRTINLNSTQETNGGVSMDHIRIIRSLGEIYSSLYYIDLAAGSFVELATIADVHAQIGASGDAQDRLNYFCHHLVTPDCRQELLAFVDLSTLNERLGNTRIVTKQFRSTLFSDLEDVKTTSWRECSFIECDRDGDGRLAHVIFCTQSIHDAKLREQGAQQKLRKPMRS